MKRELKSLTAFVAVDPENGDEGICSFHTKRDGHMPMIGADDDRVRSLRPYAEAMAKSAGITIKLVRFTVREELETIQ